MKTYTIKKGHHYSTSWLGMAWRYLTGWQRSRIAQYSVYFTKSCLTATHDPNDADDEGKDIHKLFGLSEGFGSHHQNSARFGWKEVGGEIALYTYVYRDGVRQEPKYITSVKIDEWLYLSILYSTDNTWWFIAEDTNGKVTVEANFASKPPRPVPSFYRKLYPYIGGDYTAKNDVYIHFDKITD